MKIKSLALSVLALITMTLGANAQKTIVDVAVGSADHTTLVAAVKDADLVATLQSAGNKATLAKILTYHVVAGSLNAAAVLKAIKDGGGSVTLKTVSGGSLVASIKAGKVILTDEKGGVATVVATDLGASNGLIHVIDTVVLPK